MRARPLLLALTLALAAGALARDRYGSFAELAAATKEGEDWRVVERDGSTDLLVLAPHGGGIEAGTSELAVAVAGDDHALYVFEALRAKDPDELHITSTRFDEPRCLARLRAAGRVLTLHGCQGEAPKALVGGRDEALGARVTAALAAIDVVCEPATGDLGGDARTNVANRGKSGAGVQVELSRGLRAQLFAGLDRRGRTRPTPLFARFVAALRNAVAQ